MPWIQQYAPLGNIALSALLAALPFLCLCWQLMIRRRGGHVAVATALAVALALALAVWRMPPVMAASAMLYGLAYACFPMLWVVLPVMWMYNMTVESGQFAVVRRSIAGLSPDMRVQAVFIAFAFGALLESTAGFGCPVAIGAVMLMGLGFPPVQAAGLCLLANTIPVAFGGMGLPVLVAGQVSELDSFPIGQIVGRQLPLLALFVPFWISLLVCGFRRSLEIWPLLLTAGLGCGIPTFLLANFHGVILPGLGGAIGCMLSLGVLLRFWQPKKIISLPQPQTMRAQGAGIPAGHDISAGAKAVLLAWLPWLLLASMIFLSNFSSLRSALDGFFAPLLQWPGLHELAIKTAPLVQTDTPFPALYRLNPLTAPGSWIWLTCLMVMVILPGYGFRQALGALGRTVHQMRFAIIFMLMIMPLAQLMNYSGMSFSIGLLLTRTGALFPLAAPIVGWIGVFFTGSDTSSNALFCGMQRATAEAVGMNPYLATAANTTGGVTAKMVSTQSIAVAIGATGLHGQEGSLLRFTIGHSLLMLAMICLCTWLQAGPLSFTIPAAP